MKKFVLFLFILSLSLSLLEATNPIAEGNLMTVSASSGLSLRTAPSSDSEIITIIPSGSVVEIIEVCEDSPTEIIEWTKGTWTYVGYEGRRGYVFDGYLSSLPLPHFDFEKVIDGLDLCSPIIAWAEHRFNEIEKVDTIQRNDITKVIKILSDGIILKKFSDKYVFRVDLEIDDIRIMDAYQLLENMMNKPERLSFNRHTIFITDEMEELEKIKVNIENPVIISKIDDNRIRVSVSNYHDGCTI